MGMIVFAIIALLVLVVVIFIFVSQVTDTSKDIGKKRDELTKDETSISKWVESIGNEKPIDNTQPKKWFKNFYANIKLIKNYQ